jgi:hypothetical protein
LECPLVVSTDLHSSLCKAVAERGEIPGLDARAPTTTGMTAEERTSMAVAASPTPLFPTPGVIKGSTPELLPSRARECLFLTFANSHGLLARFGEAGPIAVTGV